MPVFDNLRPLMSNGGMVERDEAAHSCDQAGYFFFTNFHRPRPSLVRGAILPRSFNQVWASYHEAGGLRATEGFAPGKYSNIGAEVACVVPQVFGWWQLCCSVNDNGDVSCVSDTNDFLQGKSNLGQVAASYIEDGGCIVRDCALQLPGKRLLNIADLVNPRTRESNSGIVWDAVGSVHDDLVRRLCMPGVIGNGCWIATRSYPKDRQDKGCCAPGSDISSLVVSQFRETFTRCKV